MTGPDFAKMQAAAAALEYVEDGMIVGLGTGSTANHFISMLGERVREGLTIGAIPTSEASRRLAASLGIPLIEVDQADRIDVTVDGADEVDQYLNLLKGGGGALLREKIVASAATQFFVFGDSTKSVRTLGVVTPVPVEIVDFARSLCMRRLSALGARPILRLRDGQPQITDEGHVILDCFFDGIADPQALDAAIHAIPGVVETGLFLGMATAAIIGGPDGVQMVYPQ